MKKIFFALITLALLFVSNSCDKELPYPVDQVKRGVVIDVSRVANTEGVLFAGITTGNYKVKFIIPENQGDYSHMKHAQLLAVLINSVDGTSTSRVIVDEITSFPQEFTLNIAEVYSKFGLSSPAIGQTMHFTANVVLKDESLIPGWTPLTGFNNVMFAGWQVEGRSFSSNVRYSVVCALDLDDFVGTNSVIRDDFWGEEPYPVEITRVGNNQLSIEGLFEGEAEFPLIITVNLVDYSLSFPRTLLAPNSNLWYGNAAYSNFSLEGTGTVNACNTSLSFAARGSVTAGTFAATFNFVIIKD